jgi:hypothetical protein
MLKERPDARKRDVSMFQKLLHAPAAQTDLSAKQQHAKAFSSWVIKTFFLHHGKISQSLPSFSYFQNCCLTKLELCTH